VEREDPEEREEPDEREDPDDREDPEAGLFVQVMHGSREIG